MQQIIIKVKDDIKVFLLLSCRLHYLRTDSRTTTTCPVLPMGNENRIYILEWNLDNPLV